MRPLVSAVFLRAQSDERLSAMAGAGNQSAFAVIFERYEKDLRVHAARIVRPDHAEDVVQQAMLSSWSALLSGAEVLEVRAWLHRIVHNAALTRIQKRGYDDGEIPAATAAPTLTEDLAAKRLTVAEALEALARLPESQRAALTLTAVEGYSGSQAAYEMGLSENAFRQLVYRARSGVRSALGALIPMPLWNWAESGSAAPSGVGIKVGSLAVAAKTAAVIAVTGASIGVTTELHAHHPRSNAQARTNVHHTPPIRAAQDHASALQPRPNRPPGETRSQTSGHPLVPAAQQPHRTPHQEPSRVGTRKRNQDDGRRQSPDRSRGDDTQVQSTTPQPQQPRAAAPANDDSEPGSTISQTSNPPPPSDTEAADIASP